MTPFKAIVYTAIAGAVQLSPLLCGAQVASSAAQAAPVAASTPVPPTAVATPTHAAARDAIATRELLIGIASRVAESDSRARATEAAVSQAASRVTWIALAGATISVALALLAAFGGIYYSRVLDARRERDLIEAGKEPLAVLIARTRDDATRLAQRLQMAGHTNTRLFRCIVDALPALQVEAGKATFNLSKQIPKAEQAQLEGSPAALDPLRPDRAPKESIPA